MEKSLMSTRGTYVAPADGLLRWSGRLALGLLVLTAACGAETQSPIITFEQLKASAYEDEPGWYIIEGDMRFDEQSLRRYYDTVLLPEMGHAMPDEEGLGESTSALTAAQTQITIPGHWITVCEPPPPPPCVPVLVCNPGCHWEERCPPQPPCVNVPVWVPQVTMYSDDVWSASTATSLTYCVANTGIAANDTRLVNAMNAARLYWNAASGARFIDTTGQDASCTASNANVVFNVQVVNTSAYLAAAFFPSYARADRQIKVALAHLTTASTADLVSTLTHELGHALGFRHEHIRANQESAASSCGESPGAYRPLTSYDGNSIMHYEFCNGALAGALTTLSPLDVAGTASIYGPTGIRPPVRFVGIAGRCLDVQAGSSATGTPLQLWDCNGTAAQQMSVEPNGEIRVFGKCLDLAGNNSANGTSIRIWDCNSTQAQKWIVFGNSLRHRESGKCLSASGGGTASGTPIQISSCGTSGQAWSMQ